MTEHKSAAVDKATSEKPAKSGNGTCFVALMRQTSAVHHFLLLALCGVLYFPYLGSTPFFDKGEPREAMAVQDIVNRGEWLVPLKRATDIPSKPPLFHWSAALISKTAGHLNEITIRLPSALYATFGVLLLYVLGRKLFTPEIALLAAAILATTFVYQNQALSARVDMTLCFVVTTSLMLFYAIYACLLTAPAWYYVLYAVVGVGTLAKGPLGLLLPALVIGIFLLLNRRWDVIRKLSFHPGVLLMILLGAGWYVIAVTRGGEGFVDRQIIQENLSRFTGGSGHSHPPYYYVPYLFSLGIPWSLFLPLALWDWFKEGLTTSRPAAFFAVWFLAMFAFFSIALGKRPVYLLPLYPAVAILLGAWFYRDTLGLTRVIFYRAMALLFGIMTIMLLVIAMGAFWNHDPGWFFKPIAKMMRPKDRANLLLVGNAIGSFGWLFTIIVLASAALWFTTGMSLWKSNMKRVAQLLILISILTSFVTRAMIMPVIAEAKSYRPFMQQVNQRVKPQDKLFLYGDGFNSDPLIFYRGGPIATIDTPAQALAPKGSAGDTYLIMTAKQWREISRMNRYLQQPILQSSGTGPEGDAPLVLVRTAAL